MLRIVLTALILCGGFIASASAVEAPRFFASLEDVPLAPGLTELVDQAVAFDKPEGRIVESVALMSSGGEESITRFYDATLPQLGWSRKGPLSFARENERLKIAFETAEGKKFMRVSVAPATAAP